MVDYSIATAASLQHSPHESHASAINKRLVQKRRADSVLLESFPIKQIHLYPPVHHTLHITKTLLTIIHHIYQSLDVVRIVVHLLLLVDVVVQLVA